MNRKIIFHKWQCPNCDRWVADDVEDCPLCELQKKLAKEAIKQKELDKQRQLKKKKYENTKTIKRNVSRNL